MATTIDKGPFKHYVMQVGVSALQICTVQCYWCYRGQSYKTFRNFFYVTQSGDDLNCCRIKILINGYNGWERGSFGWNNYVALVIIYNNGDLFFLGQCKFGATCKYSHMTPQQRNELERQGMVTWWRCFDCNLYVCNKIMPVRYTTVWTGTSNVYSDSTLTPIYLHNNYLEMFLHFELMFINLKKCGPIWFTSYWSE